MKITKIITVTDTREYEEIGERWVPIPGSGQINVCARCGKDHEVHALVELEGGEQAVVGTGCMKAETDEIKSRCKSATSAAKSLAKARAERAALARQEELNKAVEAEVAGLAVPAVEIFPLPDNSKYPLRNEQRITVFKVGEVEIWGYNGPSDGATRDHAIKAWGWGEQSRRGHRSVRAEVIEVERRIKRLEARVAG